MRANISARAQLRNIGWAAGVAVLARVQERCVAQLVALAHPITLVDQRQLLHVVRLVWCWQYGVVGMQLCQKHERIVCVAKA